MPQQRTPLEEPLPPHNVQAEEAVLAALMVNPDALAAVTPLLTAGMFFRTANGHVYTAILAAAQRYSHINMITVAHELAREGKLDDVGGLRFLSTIITNLMTAGAPEAYAAIIRECAGRRDMIAKAGAVVRDAHSGRVGRGGIGL